MYISAINGNLQLIHGARANDVGGQELLLIHEGQGHDRWIKISVVSDRNEFGDFLPETSGRHIARENIAAKVSIRAPSGRLTI